MKKILIFIFLGLLIMISVLIYYSMAVNFKNGKAFISDMVDVYGKKEIIKTYELQNRETLFFIVKTPDNYPEIEKFSFNGFYVPLVSTKVNARSRIKTLCYVVPRDSVVVGKNAFSIEFACVINENNKIDIRLHNFRKAISNRIIFLYHDNHIFGENRNTFELYSAAVLLIGIGLLVVFIMSTLYSFNVEQRLLLTCICLMFSNVMFAAAWLLVDKIYGLRFVVNSSQFFVFYIIMLVVMIISIFIFYFVKLRYSKPEKFFSIPFASICARIFRGLIDKRKFDICIIIFFSLMIPCAFLCLFKFDYIAKILADIGFVFLIIGVVGNFLIAKSLELNK